MQQLGFAPRLFVWMYRFYNKVAEVPQGKTEFSFVQQPNQRQPHWRSTPGIRSIENTLNACPRAGIVPSPRRRCKQEHWGSWPARVLLGTRASPELLPPVARTKCAEYVMMTPTPEDWLD